MSSSESKRRRIADDDLQEDSDDELFGRGGNGTNDGRASRVAQRAAQRRRIREAAREPLQLAGENEDYRDIDGMYCRIVRAHLNARRMSTLLKSFRCCLAAFWTFEVRTNRERVFCFYIY